MTKQPIALALCRVSSFEQLENNSLNRQRDAVLRAAEELGVQIPEDGWWSNHVSSKRGTNLNRKDLKEALARCKKDKRIKYVIVDEPDRFMRSIDEAAYYEVLFSQQGVKVWYASDPDLNKGDLTSKLLKFTKYFSAEGSNEERQNKSISGQTKALKEGRYPFAPKPGYMKGKIDGLQEVHPIDGPLLKSTLVNIASCLVTPTDALRDLNKTEFRQGKVPYKMDKFRKVITDPFYAGIVEVDKAVKVRNENGLHVPLITKKQHEAITEIMSMKKKNQNGPRKNGNPEYPLSNIVECLECRGKRYGRVVGFKVNNGKNKSKVYHKYRCRECGAYIHRDELHSQIDNIFNRYKMTADARTELIGLLKKVWSERDNLRRAESKRLEGRAAILRQEVANQVRAVGDPANRLIRQELIDSVTEMKIEQREIADDLFKLQQSLKEDEDDFMKFALGFVDESSSGFMTLSRDNRSKCKELIFPGGLYINKDKKVYTPEISLFYRLVETKTDTEMSEKSKVVRVRRL